MEAFIPSVITQERVDTLRDVWLDRARALERDDINISLRSNFAMDAEEGSKESIDLSREEATATQAHATKELEMENKVRYNDERTKNLIKKLKSYKDANSRDQFLHTKDARQAGKRPKFIGCHRPLTSSIKEWIEIDFSV